MFVTIKPSETEGQFGLEGGIYFLEEEVDSSTKV